MKQFTPFNPQIILAVGAHADDIDVGASGSLASWAAQGAEVHYLIITDGSRGSSDPDMTGERLVAIRQQEQRAAAQVVGVKEVHFLNYEDALLEVSLALKKDIVRIIRQVRPDTVIAMDPTMVYCADIDYINHPDHRAAGLATLDATFPMARDRMTFPDLYEAEHLEPHKVSHVLLINLLEQNFYVDISDTFSTKLQALQQHVSQFHNFDALAETLKQRAAALGRKTGSNYAEGFMRIDTQP